MSLQNVKITDTQIRQLAREFGLKTSAALRAVIEVECRGSGFIQNGDIIEPVILYEPFWAYRLLKQHNAELAEKLATTAPDLFMRKAPTSYGKLSDQHVKLQTACSLLNPYQLRHIALKSCSWGMGQVMGFNFELAGFSNFQSFINAMYSNEYHQVRAMLSFIKNKNLISDLNKGDWAGFAKVYNGPNFKRFEYDTKLAAAYKKYLKVE